MKRAGANKWPARLALNRPLKIKYVEIAPFFPSSPSTSPSLSLSRSLQTCVLVISAFKQSADILLAVIVPDISFLGLITECV